MGRFPTRIWLSAGLLFCATSSFAVTPGEKCEAAKLKAAGKYGFCQLNAIAKGVKTGTPADFSKCDEKYALKWGLAESTAGPGVCPTEGDALPLQSFITQHTDDVAVALFGGTLPSCVTTNCGNAIVDPGEQCDQNNLNGASCATQGFFGGTLTCSGGCYFDTGGCVATRFVDNADGTVTDHQTGLRWEKKTHDGTVHHVHNTYTWSATGTARDGTAFTSFLAELNSGVSADGSVIAGCFARRCDWRLPTVAELAGIIDCSGGFPCHDPIFGDAPYIYWTSTTHAGGASDAWVIYVDGEVLTTVSKSDGEFTARAVSGTAIVQCGNGILDAGESCDQGELNGETCASQGLLAGTLACTPACTFDTSGCACQIIGGACWVQGTSGADCDTTCSGIGAGVTYDPATETFAGSGGTTANCAAVISALGAAPLPVHETSCGAMGCGVVGGVLAVRCTDASTTSSAADIGFSRMCACQ